MSDRRRKSRDWNRPGYPAVTVTHDPSGPQPRGRNIAVDIELADYGDLLRKHHRVAADDEVRRVKVNGIVSVQYPKLILPQWIAEQLQLDGGRKVNIRYGDGAIVQRSEAVVSLRACRRQGMYTAIIEPNLDSVLVGFTVIADLDLVIDFERQRVVPRDPRGPVYPIE